MRQVSARMRTFFFSAAFASAALALVLSTGFFPALKARIDIRSCVQEHDGQAEVSCLYRVLDAHLGARGLEFAMRRFADMHRMSAAFRESGCHRHAHAVGDLFFARFAASGKAFENVVFPEETAACGYGFPRVLRASRAGKS